MSDPAGEPGAPSNGATKLPSASEKSVAKGVQQRAPKLARLLATPDKILLRLNKLLATPGGLSAFLSTFNYTLYLLVWAEAKSIPFRARLYELLGSTQKPYAGPSYIQALGGMLSSTRTTLRLFGLLPLYAWFRQLMQGPKPGQDQVLYATAVTQCSLYIAFQFLENVGLLTDSKVLPTSYTARWTVSNGGKTSKIYLWSCRAWLAGVACDFVRLAREAQLEREKRSKRGPSERTLAVKEDKETDAKWWSQAIVPASWMPIAIQFSSENGQPWFNLGLMGACGTLAGLGQTAKLWEATANL